MAYKHVIRAKTKNLMTDEMFTSAGFTKQPDGSWYVPNSTVLHNKVLWENTEGIAGPLIISLYGKSPQPNAAGIIQFLVTFTDGGIQYINGTGSSDVWEYSVPIIPNPTKTIAKIDWVNITGRPLYLRDVMFEWGLTTTPYTPYNYLQSNKRMIKVSDVCQILDKSKYPATQTKQGITYTNDGNGIITINGTNTASGLCVFILNRMNGKPGHKYMQLGANDDGKWNTYGLECKWVDGDGVGHGFIMRNGIMSIPSDAIVRKIYVSILVYRGYTVSNKTFKPQLFDLTEMFGAGHEPATVAEFRQRFPNEYYPYSPQCWLTSYKSAVVCKTKNLFDVNNAVVINYRSQQETTDATHYVKDGIVYSDWNNTDIGTCVGIKGGWTLPAGTYTMSAKIAYNTKRNNKDKYRGGNIGFACVLADGRKTRYVQWCNYITPGERYTYTAKIPAGCKNIMLYLGVSADTDIYSSPAAYCELMVEQGSTATSYVPYQHL